MLLLAGPGVLISTFCLGIAVKVPINPLFWSKFAMLLLKILGINILQFAFPYNWDWKTSLLLGGLLSATDPVAVVALLRELGASKKLSTIIEGESLMNDGYSLVSICLLFLIFRSFQRNLIFRLQISDWLVS